MVDETIGYATKLLNNLSRLQEKGTGCNVELISKVCIEYLIHEPLMELKLYTIRAGTLGLNDILLAVVDLSTKPGYLGRSVGLRY